MPYKKSNKQIQDSAFNMRSGNGTPFKQMGSSPTKQTSDAYKRSQEAPAHTPVDTTGKAAYMKDPKNLENFLSENPNEMSSDMFHKESKKLKPKTTMHTGTTIFGKTVPEIKQMFSNLPISRLGKKIYNKLN